MVRDVKYMDNKWKVKYPKIHKEKLQMADIGGIGNITYKKVVYSSSDPSTATVDSNGRVSFLQVGQVVIAATTADGDFTDKSQIEGLIEYVKKGA